MPVFQLYYSVVNESAFMKWYKPLFFSENLSSAWKQRRVLYKLTHNILQRDIFIIVLCENGKDLFRIIPSEELLQKAYPKADMLVLGVSKGKDEAFGLVETMIRQVYIEDGNLDRVREYYITGRKRK